MKPANSRIAPISSPRYNAPGTPNRLKVPPKAGARAPAAIINAECETITAVGCIMAEIPCVDRIDIKKIQSGKRTSIDGARVEVAIPESKA